MRARKIPAIPKANPKMPLYTKLPIVIIMDKIKAPTTPILLPRTARKPKARYNAKRTNAMTDCTANIPRYSLESMPERGKRAITSPDKKTTTEYIRNRKAIVADNTADLFQYFIELLSDSIISTFSLSVI